ncbi:MAG: hypothetical protein NXI31_18995 [bacterium]|nr:hypothetical protein [bacterium]
MRSALAVATLTAFAACSGGDSHAVGKYKLDTEAMLAGMPAPAKEMMKSMTGTMDLAADHNFTSTMTTPMGASTIAGTWKLEGDQISLTGKDEGGKEQTVTATLKDGAIVMSEDKGGMKLTMTFRK